MPMAVRCDGVGCNQSGVRDFQNRFVVAARDRTAEGAEINPLTFLRTEECNTKSVGLAVRKIARAHGETKIIHVRQFHVGSAGEYTEVPAFDHPNTGRIGLSELTIRGKGRLFTGAKAAAQVCATADGDRKSTRLNSSHLGISY